MIAELSRAAIVILTRPLPTAIDPGVACSTIIAFSACVLTCIAMELASGLSQQIHTGDNSGTDGCRVPPRGDLKIVNAMSQTT